MCTLTLAWRVLADAPVAVAANRDEAADRPSEPPDRYADDPAVIAPRDVEAGGTWIGVNEGGLVVGITNRWTATELAGDRSRGALVADALSQPTATDAASLVERAIRTHEYDGFYLVLADAEDAYVLEWDGSYERTALKPGVTVVVNVGFVGAVERVDVPARRPEAGTRQAANARRVRRALGVKSDERSDSWLDRAAGVLSDHEYGVCVHGDGYGTRSSSLLAVGGSIDPVYRFAGGPPCRTEYAPVAAMDAVESHI